MAKWTYRDYFVLGLVTLAWIVATVFLWTYPSVGSFSVWAGLCGTMTGTYHWLILLDDKKPDAQ